MALVAARMGIAVTGAHQIAANLASLCYMVPLGFSIATATLVAQALGARDAVLAETTLDTGLRLALFFAIALASILIVARPLIIALYTNDAAVAKAAFTVIGLIALFHIFDATQSVSGFVLRAYRRIIAPMVVALVALWVVGLVGGTLLALKPIFEQPAMGIDGLWTGATLGIGLAAGSLYWYAKYIARKVRLNPALMPRLGAEDERI
jgi:MATE family multidrug resistance protein